MDIQKLQVNAIILTELEALDPVTVIWQDIAPGVGQIIVLCYGEIWCYHWSSMGPRTLMEFFCKCDLAYLVGKLSDARDHEVYKQNYLHRIIVAVQQAFTSILKGEVSICV